jgi:hypothetical protein
VGVIAIGVFLALGAAQSVDSLHWAHRVHGAEEAMREELTQNKLDSYYRLASAQCAKRALDQIETLLVAARDQDVPVPVVARYSRPLRPWQSDAWDSARALQITSHIPTARLSAYSKAYFFAAIMRATQQQERQAMSELNTLPLNAGRLQPPERDRLFLALVKTRDSNRQMNLAAWLLLERTKILGFGLTPGQMWQQMSEARADYGDCVVEPRPE